MPAFYANLGRSDARTHPQGHPSCREPSARFRQGAHPQKKEPRLFRDEVPKNSSVACLNSKPERAFRPWPIRESVAVQAATKAAVPWSARAAQQGAEAVSYREAV